MCYNIPSGPGTTVYLLVSILSAQARRKSGACTICLVTPGTRTIHGRHDCQILGREGTQESVKRFSSRTRHSSKYNWFKQFRARALPALGTLPDLQAPKAICTSKLDSETPRTEPIHTYLKTRLQQRSQFAPEKHPSLNKHGRACTSPFHQR